MTIQLLAQEIRGKIAAGEVVERPANVAKELIENSLDAGATQVQVEIREGGRRLLRVTDDGRGIPAAELELAPRRHATSKLRAAADLDAITTFGFRGEALYSIAAVSRMRLGSRHADAEAGAEILIEGGVVTQSRPAGLPVGTVVSVEELFFNTPARRKFLRRPTTEAGHIAAIVQRYALAYPERRFQYHCDGKLVFSSEGSGRIADVLAKAHGRESADQMIELGRPRAGGSPSAAAAQRASQAPEGEINFMRDEPPATARGGSRVRVSGCVSPPSLTRASRAKIDIFVNRRYVEDRSLTHAVVQAYHTLLPVGRYPLAALFIELDASEVDVNVHPRKTEVRFADARRIYAAVQRSVRRALIENATVPELSAGGVGGDPPHESAALPASPQPAETGDQAAWAVRRQAILNAGAGRQPPMPTPAPPASAPAPAHDVDADAGPAPAASALPPLRVVGQAGAMYVVAEGPEGLYLIDQHAAHERILYEKFMAQREQDGEGRGRARQGLLEPISIHVGETRAGLIAQRLPELNAVGFHIEHFGGDAFLVRAVPSALSHQDAQRTLDEIAQGLEEDRDLVGEQLEARLVMMVCKRASIKAGQILSDIEMKELVRQLEQCRAPRTCPHGRPTMLQLSAGELERAFKRA